MPGRSVSAQPWSSGHDGVARWFHGDFMKDLLSALYSFLPAFDGTRVIYVCSDAIRQESRTKFAFSSANVPPRLSYRFVNEPWRTLSVTPRLAAPWGGLEYHPAVLESSRELRTALPEMGVPPCPRSKTSRSRFSN